MSVCPRLFDIIRDGHIKYRKAHHRSKVGKLDQGHTGQHTYTKTQLFKSLESFNYLLF